MSQVEVEIRDDGRGFPQKALERGLEPFFRNSSTGSGRGLAIAQRILDRHGATIAVSNRSPHGGCVRVGLRAITPPAA